MANGSSRALAVVLSLIVGFVAGWLLHTAPKKQLPPRPATAQSWKISIGPDDPCTLRDPSGGNADTQRAKRGRDAIEWESADKKAFIYIIAHVPKCATNPFPKGTKIGSDASGNDLYLIGDGKTPKVDTGTIDANACPTNDLEDPSSWIKYDQFLQINGYGTFRSCDGWIIVDK